jgi:UDP-N-acetylglucosamine 2-epimerase (non-hydrolysing)
MTRSSKKQKTGKHASRAPRKRIAVILGTRPEAIKLAPVILALRNEPWADCRVVVTGQHREMLDQVLSLFKIKPHEDLHVMRRAQSLGQLSVRLMAGLDKLLREQPPDLIIVQGDTTTVAVTSYLGFCHRIPVAHVEAGLRTNDRWSPFPEEINRRITSLLATIHFCPSEQAREVLLAENLSAGSIHLVRNTVIDALFLARSALRAKPRALAGVDFSKRTILVTMHRRESFGAPMEAICRAIAAVVAAHPEVRILLPVHKSPVVRQTVLPLLAPISGVHLVEPLDYQAFVYAMKECHFIMTDSGGVQEEAPALGKPVLVLRENTERPEAVRAGAALLVGTNEQAIVSAAEELLSGGALYRRMARPRNIYGDGKAAARIVDVLREELTGAGK